MDSNAEVVMMLFLLMDIYPDIATHCTTSMESTFHLQGLELLCL